VAGRKAKPNKRHCCCVPIEAQGAAKNGGRKGAGSIAALNARPRGEGRRRDDGAEQALLTISPARHDILAIQLNWRLSPARSAKQLSPLQKSSNQKKHPDTTAAAQYSPLAFE